MISNLAIPVGILAAIAAALALAGCATPSSFTPRLAEPRLAVVDETDLTEAQRDMLASRSSLNIYRTLANHVDLYNRWSPLGQILLNGSSISPRHREMAMLRMGWLCQSPYEWSQHARIAKASAGLTDAESQVRVGVGVGAGPAAVGGGTVHYTITLEADPNQSFSGPAYNVTLDDPLIPGKVTLAGPVTVVVNGVAQPVLGSGVSVTIPVLLPTDRITITFDGLLDPTVIAGEQLVNTVTGTTNGTVNLNFTVPTNAVTAAALRARGQSRGQRARWWALSVNQVRASR